MTIFELVKAVLDDIYVEASDQYGPDVDAQITSRIAHLAAAYKKLNTPSFTPINYKDPATRFAYVYKYVPAHADYVVQILQRLQDELNEPVFSTTDIRVSCIGGGPGSDLIGLLKYLDLRKEKEPVRSVTAYLLDKEQAWADTWTELNVPLDLELKLNSVFQPLDVTNPASWESQKKFLQADLFTLSYFVSEIKSLDNDGKLSHFWNAVFSGAKPGAYFIYDDNCHSSFTDYFDEKWQAHKIEPILKVNTVMTPRSSEQASELSNYKTKFEQTSKLRGDLTYRVLRKS